MLVIQSGNSNKVVVLHLGFPRGSDGKAPAYDAGDPALIPGWGRSPGEGKETAAHSNVHAWRSHGPRTLVDYNPWGRKESDTTERLHLLRLGH